jgi:hypothetical protein
MADTFNLGVGNTNPSFRRQLLEADPDRPRKRRIADLSDVTGASMRIFPAACTPWRDGPSPLGGAGFIVSVPAALFQYDFAAADVRTRGEFLARVRVTYSDGSFKDFPNDGWDRIVVS